MEVPRRAHLQADLGHGASKIVSKSAPHYRFRGMTKYPTLGEPTDGGDFACSAGEPGMLKSSPDFLESGVEILAIQ